MSEKLKNKEIIDIVILELNSILISEGFILYKGKQFVKVENDIVFYIELFPIKNDFYIWYAIYPLCEYSIWFGNASIASRFPDKEGVIKVYTTEDVENAVDTLVKGCSTILSFFKNRSSIPELEKSITEKERLFPLLVKGYCLAELGRPKDAQLYIQKFIDSGLNGGNCKTGAEQLMTSIKNGLYKVELEKNKVENLKKLRLKKFII